MEHIQTAEAFLAESRLRIKALKDSIADERTGGSKMSSIPATPNTLVNDREPKPMLKGAIEDHQCKLFHLAALLKCLAGVDEDFGAELVHSMRTTIGDAASTASALADDIYEWNIAYPNINEQEAGI